MKLDYVVGLKIEDFLERRLPTQARSIILPDGLRTGYFGLRIFGQNYPQYFLPPFGRLQFFKGDNFARNQSSTIFAHQLLVTTIVASAQKTVSKQRGIYLRLQQPMSSMYEFMLFNLLIKCMRPCQ